MSDNIRKNLDNNIAAQNRHAMMVIARNTLALIFVKRASVRVAGVFAEAAVRKYAKTL